MVSTKSHILLTAIIIFVSNAVRGQLILEEGFESGRQPFKPTDKSRGNIFKPSGNSPEVVEATDARAGKHVLKSDFNDRAMILQWHYQDKLHPEVRDAQPLLLRFKDDQVHVENEVLQKYMATVEPAYGEWVDWVFHVKFSDQDGIIRVWRNGKQIVDWKGDNHQVEKHEGTYLKLGIYSSQYEKKPPKCNYKRTVYHDELRITGANGSFEMVSPGGSSRQLQ